MTDNTRRQRRHFLACLPAGCLAAAWALPVLAQSPQATPYSLSVVPQLSASVTAQNWTPLVEELGRAGIAARTTWAGGPPAPRGAGPC